MKFLWPQMSLQMYHPFKPSPASPYRVCFIAKYGGGAWEIRGRQMASVRSNWKATLNLKNIDLRQFDIFVFVKHVDLETILYLKEKRKIVVYDIIDSWKQPEDGMKYTDLASVREFFRKKWLSIPADSFIFPNEQMKLDLKDLTPHSTHIYHHYRPRLRPARIRKKMRRIGYEGVPEYLGKWRPIIEKICRSRGLAFVVNPLRYRSLDAVFAARHGPHDSFMANRYKSNVKLANCYGAALPCLASRKEISYVETDNGCVSFFTSEEELEAQIEDLLNYERRVQIHESFLKKRTHFSIDHIAEEYERHCSDVISRRGLS